ncbi:MAG: hypothetical protein DVB28_001944 [Verrucomicrobia bacterium]|nr:MAG: hypothetical protein DVB28_001944 [Verrucomicrobiota bacterium]
MIYQKLQTALVLGGALGAGALAGWLGQEPLPSPVLPAAAPTSVESVAGGLPENAEGAAPAAPLANQSVPERFGDFDLQKQTEVLVRLENKLGKDGAASALLVLAKIAQQLSAEQAAALLEAFPAGKIENEEVRRFLAERLAAEDPQRALELGKKLGDGKLLSAAVAALGEKNAAQALQAVADLPEKQRKEVLERFLSQREGSRFGGSVDEVVAVLKQNPTILSSGASGLLGNMLAEMALRNPAEALARVQSLAAEISSAAKADPNDHSSGPQAVSHGMWQGLLGELRTRDPRAASEFFDSIPDAAKTSWMFPEEALYRFREGGVDAAIALAEKQSNEDFTKRAASGVWWGFAQQDRPAALSWIESLPEGAFRQGVLRSVMMDSWLQSMNWGSDRTAIEAGAALLSKNSQLDYYASLMSDRRFGGMGSSPSEIIAMLPLSEGEKLELYRRIAPIKAP